MNKRKGWHVVLMYTTKREFLTVRDERLDGTRRKAVFHSKTDAKECQRVLSQLITASHFEGSTLHRED